ncbi:hypothetical protein PROFUN_16232 [Planoprotostelium fungivorum]|uniref:Uncharacterized protein n=1 Tax=Planoprotostelium fungivorum TaxID=1890364 RepID=A0A2P6MPM3_9EUKA|nr:hypothetical protein PROFUN_16232 [Planoprotostelium fungivorum]
MKLLTLLLFAFLLSRAEISVLQNFYSDLSCTTLEEITISPANVCLPEEADGDGYSIKASLVDGNYSSYYWGDSSNCTGTSQLRDTKVENQCYSRESYYGIQSWKVTSGKNFGTTLTSNDTVTVYYTDNNCTKLQQTMVKINRNCTAQNPQNRGVCVSITDSRGGPAGAQIVYCGSDSVIQNINQNKSSITDISRPGQANSLHRVPLIFCLAIILLLVL